MAYIGPIALVFQREGLMLTHLFIDFDNTMMATEHYAIPSLIARFNTLYGSQISQPLTIDIFATHFHGQAREILCANLSQYFSIQVDTAKLYQDREWEMMQALQKVPGGINMAPHLIEVLRTLYDEHKVRAALVSNNPIQRALTAMRFAANGQGDTLAALLGTRFFEAGDRQKPLPDVYLRAMAQTDAKIETSCAIEDSHAGAMAAHTAGLRVFGFTGFSTTPEETAKALRDAGCLDVFTDWKSLPEYLRRYGMIR